MKRDNVMSGDLLTKMLCSAASAKEWMHFISVHFDRRPDHSAYPLPKREQELPLLVGGVV
jgi:hypothetical protein